MYPTWKKVGICLATGICTVQLQFAFRRHRRISTMPNLGRLLPFDAVSYVHKTLGACRLVIVLLVACEIS